MKRTERIKGSGPARAAIAMALTLLATVHEAPAGQARYDPATRSIKLTYTFASLAEGYAGGAAIGSPQVPTNEQHAIVRSLLKEVNDAVSQATGGRLTISSLDRVDDVRNVDLVISMSGKPASAGWAIVGAIEGKPGQIGLFYQTLADRSLYVRRDAVLAASHELSHYLFSLTDEYAFPGGCPLDHPGSPGCLMDNYNTNGVRHGWYGRYCNDSDHVHGQFQQPRSCQSMVDEFFAARGNPSPQQGNGDEAQLGYLADAAFGHAQEQAAARKGPRSPTGTFPSGAVRSSADKFLREQVARLGLNVSPQLVRKTVVDVSKDAARIPLGNPGRLDKALIGELTAKAAKSAAESLIGEPGSAQRATVRSAILRELLGIAKAALFAAAAPSSLTADEQRYIAGIAAAAAAESPEERRFERLVTAARLQIKFDQETAVTTVEIADELGIPGTPDRLKVLRELDEELRSNALPGRTSSRFGRRRTLIIAPDPIDPKYDYIPTKDGIHHYDELRDDCIDEFNRLIDRAKVLPTLVTGAEVQGAPFLGGLRDRRPEIAFGEVDRPDTAHERNEAIRRIFAQAIDQIRRNRIENIIIVVPPGGLPPDLGRSLETIRTEMISKADLRLDVVLLCDEVIPAQLRDLSMRSGGSILTITDIDEVGALAQRLKNAQSAGAWVVIPLQDEIRPLGEDAAAKEPAKSYDAQSYKQMVVDTLASMAADVAALRKIAPTQGAQDLEDAIKATQKAVAASKEMTYDRFISVLGPFVRAQDALRRIRLDAVGGLRDAGQPGDPGAIVTFPGGQPQAAQARPAEPSQTPEALVASLSAHFRRINGPTAQLLGAPAASRIDRRAVAEAARTLIVPDAGGQTPEQLATRRTQQQDALKARNDDPKGREFVIPLLPFYAEKGAKFELIVGSTEPLPGVTLPLAREETPWAKKLPGIRLTDADGKPVEAPALLLDRDASTDTILVYRLQFLKLFDGKFYFAELVLDKEEYSKLDHAINFTFSVSSSRPNVQLHASLVQAPPESDIDPPPADRGTVRTELGQARIEVQVFGGTSVRDAHVFGGLQKLTPGVGPIDLSYLSFKDGGADGDRVADDGVYTALIPIDRLGQEAEYRVSIQALSTPKSRNIVPEDPNAGDAARRKALIDSGFKKIVPKPATPEGGDKDATKADETPSLGKALEFERATSIHFRVER
ncbi:choice-of-anchor X domain-containing protein [Isosphaeraceae bacterium EP7]